MIEDFDIRPFIRVLLQYWLWLLGGAILAAGLALLLYSITPRQYEATTLIAISEPRQEIQFDPRIDSTNESQSVSAFPDLATSDEVLGLLQRQLPETVENSEALTSFRPDP